MQILLFLQNVLAAIAGDAELRSSINFGGMVATLVGTCYLLCAIHENRHVNRLIEIVSSAILGALGFALVLYLGFHQGSAGVWVGLAFGLGLWLGYEFMLSLRILMGDVVGWIQNAIRVLFSLTLGNAIALLHLILSPVMVLAALIAWFTLWLVTLPVLKVAQAVLRRPVTLQGAIRSHFGLPRSAVIIMLRPMLPKNSTFMWLFWASYKVLIYALTLVVGYVVARICDPVIRAALSGQEPDAHLLVLALLVGAAVGYIHVHVSGAQSILFDIHDPEDPAMESMESELEPVSTLLTEALEDEGVAEFLSKGAAYAEENLSDLLFHSQDKPAVSSNSVERETALRVRTAAIRPMTLHFSDLTVGLLTGLVFGTLADISTTGSLVWTQRAIVFGISFVFGSLAQRVGALTLGILGVSLFVLGIAMQLLQFFGP